MTISQQTDVMVDVTPAIAVFRQDGKWHWRGGPNTTQADVIRELAGAVARMHIKNSLLEEALASIKSASWTNTP